MVEELFHELSNLNEVEAIALGGSRAGKNYLIDKIKVVTSYSL